MKNCPFCNAELEENSSFCIYCMTSLDNKEKISSPFKKRKSILLVILLFVLILICLVVKIANNNKNEASTEPMFNSITTNGENINSTSSEEPSTIDNAISTTIENESVSTTENSTITTSPEEIETTTTAEVVTEPATDGATYVYRNARQGDDFSVSYTFPDNAIVITDVTTPAKNGVYVIPAEIDGKPVVAIMGLAFCNENVASTVKKVVVPASVKTIWGNAFVNCYNLTDIYFLGNSIYVENSAFANTENRTGTLTIHCSSSCNDRNLRYYKNSATNYDAQFKEWNGGEYN